jgi:FkbM family methyltransferase
MTLATPLQAGFVCVVRPISDVRGAGRVSRIINRAFLNAGVPPIQIARMRDGNKMRLDLRSQTEWYAFYSGHYDDAAIQLLRNLLSQVGGSFLDVGGNIGMYGIRVVAGLGTTDCLCFEPMPDNAARILENAKLNDAEDRVQVHQVALSDTEGETELVLREDFKMGSVTGNASIAISEDADGCFHRIQVSMRRFDEVLEDDEEKRFHVAKVDIEGHEDFFFRGASDWLQRDRPIILTEINNWFYEKRGTTSSDVFAPCLPAEYKVALFTANTKTAQLNECSVDELANLRRVETCILYPAERARDIYNALPRR